MNESTASQRKWNEKRKVINERTAKKRFERRILLKRIKTLSIALIHKRLTFKKQQYNTRGISNSYLADKAFQIDNMAEELQNLIYEKESIDKQIQMIEKGQAEFIKSG